MTFKEFYLTEEVKVGDKAVRYKGVPISGRVKKIERDTVLVKYGKDKFKSYNKKFFEYEHPRDQFTPHEPTLTVYKMTDGKRTTYVPAKDRAQAERDGFRVIY